MTENLTKRFVDHRGIALAAKRVSEFSLHHRERRFNVAPLVVMPHEFVPAKLEVVKHLLPSSPAKSLVMIGQRDERNRANGGNRFHVCFAGVSFVRRDFPNLEILSSRLKQRRKLFGIVSVPAKNLYSRDHVRLDANHNVALDPIMLLPNLSVLVIEPTVEAGSSETRRINGKVGFDGLQRQTRFDNAALQKRSQFGVVEVIGNAVEVGNLRDVTAPVGFPQVGHEAALRDGGIDFERDVENGIRNRKSRATGLLAFGNRTESRAQIVQQGLEPILFADLSGIVGRPRLRVRSLVGFRKCNALSHRGSAVRIALPLHHKRSGIDMLARRFTFGEVGALASRKLLGNLNGTVRGRSEKELSTNHPASESSALPLFPSHAFLSGP